MKVCLFASEIFPGEEKYSQQTMGVPMTVKIIPIIPIQINFPDSEKPGSRTEIKRKKNSNSDD